MLHVIFVIILSELKEIMFSCSDLFSPPGGVQLPHIVPVLEAVGSHLTQLRFLCYGGNSGQMDVSLVTRACPRLETLTLSGNSVVSPQGWPGHHSALLPDLKGRQSENWS